MTKEITETQGLGDLKKIIDTKKDAELSSNSINNESSNAENETINLDNESNDVEKVNCYEVIKDELGRSYATGKRKNAVARVWIKSGSGKIVVNGRDYLSYFARPVLQMILKYPFKIANCYDKFDVFCTVKGGGLSGQAGAVKHGISKALCFFTPTLRGVVKKAGLLTRDSRIVERKKYGLRKARRSFQFSKR